MAHLTYSLRSLLLGVSIVAVAIQAYLWSSVLWYLVVLGCVLFCNGLCVWLAIKSSRNRMSYITFIIVSAAGIALTVCQRFPISQVNIIESMYTNSLRSGVIAFNAAAHLGIVYLYITCAAALSCSVVIAVGMHVRR